MDAFTLTLTDKGHNLNGVERVFGGIGVRDWAQEK